jgi:hypothetical protein
MTDHLALALEDIEAKIATLTDLRDKLHWFRREFPRTAASMVPIETAVAGKGHQARRAAASVRGVQADRAGALATRLVAAVTAAGGEIKVSALRAQLKGSNTVPQIQRAITALLKDGQLEKRGWRVAVPGAAKEEL